MEPHARANALSGTSILTGALICTALLLVVTLLATGIGLAFNTRGALVLFVTGLVLLLPFLAGGYVTARFATQSGATAPVLHAVTMWAGVVVVGLYVLSSQAIGLTAGLLAQLGLSGLTTVQTSALLETISELKPRFETEVNLDQKKAVTTLIMNADKKSMASEVAEAAREESSSVSGMTSDKAKTEIERRIEAGSRAASWIGLAFLAASCAVSSTGAWVAARAHTRRR